jgi:tetratricopeptide (TPR) repeat protein
MQTGDLKKAQSMYEEALAIATEKKIPDNEVVEGRLAYVHALRGDVTGALALAKAARDGAAKGEGENSYDAADIHYFYGRILEMAEQPRIAEAEYRASLASQAALLPPDGMHVFSADARYALGKLLIREVRSRDEGRRFLQQAASLREAALGADHPRVVEVRKTLAESMAPR